MATLNPNTQRGVRRFAAPALLLFFFAAAEGCQLISGLNDLEPGQESASASASASASTSMSTSSTTTTTTTCAPGSVQDCYTGPGNTEGVGICAGGTQTCNADGSAWEACSGEVIPEVGVENCAKGVDANCDGKSACTGAMAWATTAGSPTDIVAHAAAVDSTGEVVIVGSFSGTAMIGPFFLVSADPSPDIFVAKLDKAGAVKWATSYGGTGEDAAISVAVTPDDFIVLTGLYTSQITFGGVMLPAMGGGDMFVTKLDKGGYTVWSLRAGDAATQAGYSIATDSAGNSVIAGYFDGTIDFGQGPLMALGRDGFVAKYDQAGNILWGKAVSGDGEQFAHAVAVNSEGHVVVTGRVTGSASLAGAPLDGGMGIRIFAGKLSADAGAPLWAKLFNGVNDMNLGVSAARAGLDGETVIGGRFGDTIDFGEGPVIADVVDAFLVKLDKEGTILWGKGLGGPGNDLVHEVAADDFGNITVAGELTTQVSFDPPQGPILTSRGMSDGFIAKLAPDGAALWAFDVGGPNLDGAYGVAVDALGASYATGKNGAPLFIGEKEVSVPNKVSIFVTKLDP